MGSFLRRLTALSLVMALVADPQLAAQPTSVQCPSTSFATQTLALSLKEFRIALKPNWPHRRASALLLGLVLSAETAAAHPLAHRERVNLFELCLTVFLYAATVGSGVGVSVIASVVIANSIRSAEDPDFPWKMKVGLTLGTTAGIGLLCFLLKIPYQDHVLAGSLLGSGFVFLTPKGPAAAKKHPAAEPISLRTEQRVFEPGTWLGLVDLEAIYVQQRDSDLVAVIIRDKTGKARRISLQLDRLKELFKDASHAYKFVGAHREYPPNSWPEIVIELQEGDPVRQGSTRIELLLGGSAFATLWAAIPKPSVEISAAMSHLMAFGLIGFVVAVAALFCWQARDQWSRARAKMLVRVSSSWHHLQFDPERLDHFLSVSPASAEAVIDSLSADQTWTYRMQRRQLLAVARTAVEERLRTRLMMLIYEQLKGIDLRGTLASDPVNEEAIEKIRSTSWLRMSRQRATRIWARALFLYTGQHISMAGPISRLPPTSIGSLSQWKRKLSLFLLFSNVLLEQGSRPLRPSPAHSA